MVSIFSRIKSQHVLSWVTFCLSQFIFIAEFIWLIMWVVFLFWIYSLRSPNSSSSSGWLCALEWTGRWLKPAQPTSSQHNFSEEGLLLQLNCWVFINKNTKDLPWLSRQNCGGFQQQSQPNSDVAAQMIGITICFSAGPPEVTFAVAGMSFVDECNCFICFFPAPVHVPLH